jgi:predicted ATPase
VIWESRAHEKSAKVVLVGCTKIMNGDYQSALQHLRQAVELYDPTEHRRYTLEFAQDIGVRAFCYLSLALWHRGFPDQASKAAGEALRYAKESMHAHTLAYALFFGAMTAVLQRRAMEVEERATASINLAKEHGFALWLGRGQILRGWAMAQRGGGTAAVERIQEGLSATAATGSALWRPFLSALLAEALGLAGKMDEALMVLTQGAAAAADSSQVGTDAELHRLRGQLLRDLPDPDWIGAENSFRSSIAIARQQGSRGFELRAAVDLARLLADQVRRGEALAVLAPVYGEFGEGFEMPDLIECKTLLSALS